MTDTVPCVVGKTEWYPVTIPFTGDELKGFDGHYIRPVPVAVLDRYKAAKAEFDAAGKALEDAYEQAEINT